MAEPDLVAWLTALLDEHQAVAQREHKLFGWRWDDKAADADSTLVGMFSPAAVLADIASKRSILAIHYPEDYTNSGIACARCSADGEYPGAGAYPCPTVRALGAAYAHQQGYLEGWKP